MFKKELILIIASIILFGNFNLEAQINSAEDALKMYAVTKKEDSSKVRVALENWSNSNKNDYRPYLFLLDYNVIQNILLLQEYANLFEEEQEFLFEKRVALIEDYIKDAKRLAPNALDVKLSALYAAFIVLTEEQYQRELLDILSFNKENDFNWQVDNIYKVPIDYHHILDSMAYENTPENKFLYWFFVWGQNNLKNHSFLPYERTERLMHYTGQTLLQAYPNSMHVHLLLFHIYKDMDKEEIALTILQKAVDLFPKDYHLKLIFAAESFNALSAYEILYPFRLKANTELKKLIAECEEELLVRKAKELKDLLFSDKE